MPIRELTPLKTEELQNIINAAQNFCEIEEGLKEEDYENDPCLQFVDEFNKLIELDKSEAPMLKITAKEVAPLLIKNLDFLKAITYAIKQYDPLKRNIKVFVYKSDYREMFLYNVFIFVGEAQNAAFEENGQSKSLLLSLQDEEKTKELYKFLIAFEKNKTKLKQDDYEVDFKSLKEDIKELSKSPAIKDERRRSLFKRFRGKTAISEREDDGQSASTAESAKTIDLDEFVPVSSQSSGSAASSRPLGAASASSQTSSPSEHVGRTQATRPAKDEIADEFKR